MLNKSYVKVVLLLLRSSAVPLISLATFVPIFVTYFPDQQISSTESQASESQVILPPPSLLPSPISTPQNPTAKTTSQSDSPPTQSNVVKANKPNSTNEKIVNQNPPAPSKAVTKHPTVKQNQTQTLPVSYNQSAATQLEIRVAVLRDGASTTIASSTSAFILDRDGKVLQTIAAGEGLSVIPNAGGLSIGNHNLPPVVFVKPSNNGLVYLGDRWYRGKMLLVSQGSSLLAVNYVDLESYLYSVVGSEMHANAPMQALKAQAIAARSYALVHMIRPANPWFHLGNTQRWQVYKGLASEYNTSQQAVNATAGQILSYKGGVVESLYAATDEIVSRAHGGRGMSQTGAYELARNGYDHQQILSYYYPGVGLAQLVLQQWASLGRSPAAPHLSGLSPFLVL